MCVSAKMIATPISDGRGKGARSKPKLWKRSEPGTGENEQLFFRLHFVKILILQNPFFCCGGCCCSASFTFYHHYPTNRYDVYWFALSFKWFPRFGRFIGGLPLIGYLLSHRCVRCLFCPRFLLHYTAVKRSESILAHSLAPPRPGRGIKLQVFNIPLLNSLGICAHFPFAFRTLSLHLHVLHL